MADIGANFFAQVLRSIRVASVWIPTHLLYLPLPSTGTNTSP